MHIDPMHAARLALLEGALRSLLGAAQEDEHPQETPDGITATLDAAGLDVVLTRNGQAIGGFGL